MKVMLFFFAGTAPSTFRHDNLYVLLKKILYLF